MKDDMGGLRKHMPITFTTFVIGSLALAGIFPFAGFWSKDEVLVTAGKSGFTGFMIVGLIGALLTAAYMTRCIYLTFFGEYRGHGHPHESEPAITGPLVVLAAFSVVAGFVNIPGFHRFEEWFEPRVAFPALVHPKFSVGLAALSVTLAGVGIAAAAAYYFRPERVRAVRGLTERSAAAGAGYRLLENKYFLDRLYEGVIVAGIREPIARGVYWFNQSVIDRAVNAFGSGARRAGRFTYDVIDQKVVDAAVNDVANLAGNTGGLLRYVQSGRVQRYALLLVGAVGLLSLILLIANT
jgi:NADH-quinone oxidoreductase subunit L